MGKREETKWLLDARDSAAFERLVDAVACAIYEEGCFAYYGGDVGMTYWKDMSDEDKRPDREQARDLILKALGPEATT